MCHIDSFLSPDYQKEWKITPKPLTPNSDLYNHQANVPDNKNYSFCSVNNAEILNNKYFRSTDLEVGTWVVGNLTWSKSEISTNSIGYWLYIGRMLAGMEQLWPNSKLVELGRYILAFETTFVSLVNGTNVDFVTLEPELNKLEFINETDRGLIETYLKQSSKDGTAKKFLKLILKLGTKALHLYNGTVNLRGRLEMCAEKGLLFSLYSSNILGDGNLFIISRFDFCDFCTSVLYATGKTQNMKNIVGVSMERYKKVDYCKLFCKNTEEGVVDRCLISKEYEIGE